MESKKSANQIRRDRDDINSNTSHQISPEVDKSYRYWRIRVMYSMMIGYATFYFVRKNISMVTKSITDEFGFSNTEWGVVLSTATIAYAISKFASGILADRINPKYLMSLGLLASALANFAFGLSNAWSAFLVIWAINSLFQGMGMPPCSRLLTSWFSQREIGRAWGVWNASHQIGGAVIVVVSGYLVAHFGWRSAFFIPAIVALIVSLWLYNRLTDSPESMGLPPIEEFKPEDSKEKTPEALPFAVAFRKHILTNKWVWIVSIANFFVYIVRIGILDWAPKFLEEAKGFDIKQAGIVLSTYELAGIFGAFAAGWLSDTVFKGKRGPVSILFMLLLVSSVFILMLVPSGQILAMSGIFILIGFFVYGPQMLIAVAAADFASRSSAATAVGLTGLFGYMGATVCGIGTGVLVDHYGWSAALYFYLTSAIIGTALLLSTWHR
ncbi:MFS transporter [Pseudobacteriovorax antillogorgiicola]|uniref:MFS transporter, OPA family, glycerol-3-phosphate transporter/MFS transporter, OPA family, sugar phosphate sensor protein UhpC n=1 Tax=Pseudobacteriovorax antillogorgiicola TaxID=1513793 RepID=A0A1Y6CF76_9BACT|nr:MFS transporter [Pseudobacteriovorax antillogorgiicola]TCS49057.1 OPA family glycerol-3-phosphate transporter-like MFS transporter/OPA family sugar phosphate sensor protein UhpC-like MFS transporter [Pseudobacteriovorax antillogorgiicola]SMF52410.1 MFS transporter, OPA family, glycerol-3-phosphate transporter/MFS transporter, OPA family, sugar phosphate sensor protein UhpC [Pseudobacteriovorax antillogorgiicola]